ncbi:hypothetical protein [Microlunatus soli]|uniref:Uncharacterized protein n=1 Tax=Microlunatus soli TaxID=630515 RepID=A0A1H1PDK7_9ACTN|nr:hypothetical protein [Microlunatus soli]SDS09095.1 hypothetical protein SAMN04489812_0853 [Microlunatus soli]
MNRISKIATVAALTVAGFGVASTGTVPTASAAPTSGTPQQVRAAQQTHQFGDTVTVDGFKITITHQHAGRLPAGDDFAGHYAEDITIHIAPTQDHQEWKPSDGWSDRIRYGAHQQHEPTLVAGQGFADERPWVAGGRYAVGKQHYAKHLHYTFSFRGHKINWVND